VGEIVATVEYAPVELDCVIEKQLYFPASGGRVHWGLEGSKVSWLWIGSALVVGRTNLAKAQGGDPPWRQGGRIRVGSGSRRSFREFFVWKGSRGRKTRKHLPFL